jgi:hypothetical protein
MHDRALIRTLLAFMLATAALATGGDAAAKSFQPDLRAFATRCPPGNGGCETDLSGFDDFAGQLAASLMSRFPGPIATIGSHGFEVSYTIGMTELDRGSGGFHSDASTGRPAVFSNTGGVLTVGQLQVRKGLPYSFQVGGTVTQVFGSSMWDTGLQLAWTPLEGIRNAPDLGLHLQGGILLGAGDLILVHAGAALILSKALSVAGLFTLAPFGGYQFMYVSASTHLTDAYGPDQTKPNLFAIDPRNMFLHRLVFGLEAVASWVVIGAEMTVQVPNANRTYALRLGAKF